MRGRTVGALQRSYSALLGYERCVAAMLADPQMYGDRLLAGLWLARIKYLDDPGRGRAKYSDCAMAVFGCPDGDRVVRVIVDDMPPYDPDSGTWGTRSGGVLARHLPSSGWVRRWRKLSGLEDRSEDQIADEPAKPMLYLVRDDAEGEGS